MSEPGQVGDAFGRLCEGGERLAVQRDFSARPDGPLDGEAGQLVAERHAIAPCCQHPRSQALIKAGGRFPGDRLQEPQLGPGGHDGHRVEHGPRWRAQGRGASEARRP